jgi:hypothetical protein
MNTPTRSVALLLELITTPPEGNPTGIRVYADGRYDFLSDTQIDVAADGSSTARPVPLEWRTITTFTAEELDELRTAVAAADFPALKPRYTPAGTVFDTGRQTWRAWLDGQVYEVVVEGYPVNRVSALETLYARFSALRKLPPSRSVWQVWIDGRIEQRSVECDVSTVNELRALVQALLAPTEPAPGTPELMLDDLPDLPADTPLVTVLWQEQGRPDEQTILSSDGRLVRLVAGQETLVQRLTSTQIGTVLDAAARIDWAGLPDPICP